MSDDTRFDFEIGELVQHLRYRYRGVVAGRDASCRADDSWYLRNQTQPDRDQPWYHVLVHGGEHTTYVAQENLESDIGAEQVVHPMTRSFFEYFQGGRYIPRPSEPNTHES